MELFTAYHCKILKFKDEANESLSLFSNRSEEGGPLDGLDEVCGSPKSISKFFTSRLVHKALSASLKRGGLGHQRLSFTKLLTKSLPKWPR